MTKSGIILWNLHHYQRKMEGLKPKLRELFLFTFINVPHLKHWTEEKHCFFGLIIVCHIWKNSLCGSESQAERQACIEIYTEICERNLKYIEFAHRSPFWGPLSHAGCHCSFSRLAGKGGVLPKFELSLQTNWLSVRISLLTETLYFLVTSYLWIASSHQDTLTLYGKGCASTNMPSAGAVARLASSTRSWMFSINVKDFTLTSSLVLSMLISLALLKLSVDFGQGCPKSQRKEVWGGKACQDLFEMATPGRSCNLRVASHCLQNLLLWHNPRRAEGQPKMPQLLPVSSQGHPPASERPTGQPSGTQGQNGRQELKPEAPGDWPTLLWSCQDLPRTAPAQHEIPPPAAKGGDDPRSTKSGQKEG